MITVSILTISDRSFRGERADLAGPPLQERCAAQNWAVVRTAILPDSSEMIQAVLREWADDKKTNLILTSGGTGLSPRDVTPEATLQVIERVVPGLAEKMRADSLKVTPYAALSRSICGTRGTTLIINLPGSPKAAQECFESIAGVIPHAVALLQEDLPAVDKDHQNIH